MPPYLIGTELSGIDPFSESKRPPNTKDASHMGSVPKPTSQQPTPFEVLTERLIRFVQERQSAGAPINDESLQPEALCFVYGDEDPWNQTAADNPDCLQLFKDGMGLGPSVSSVSNGVSFPLPWTLDMTSTRHKIVHLALVLVQMSLWSIHGCLGHGKVLSVLPNFAGQKTSRDHVIPRNHPDRYIALKQDRDGMGGGMISFRIRGGSNTAARFCKT